MEIDEMVLNAVRAAFEANNIKSGQMVSYDNLMKAVAESIANSLSVVSQEWLDGLRREMITQGIRK